MLGQTKPSAIKLSQRAAWTAGHAAWHAGQTEEDCPPDLTQRPTIRVYWLNGWRKAAEDADLRQAEQRALDHKKDTMPQTFEFRVLLTVTADSEEEALRSLEQATKAVDSVAGVTYNRLLKEPDTAATDRS